MKIRSPQVTMLFLTEKKYYMFINEIQSSSRFGFISEIVILSALSAFKFYSWAERSNFTKLRRGKRQRRAFAYTRIISHHISYRNFIFLSYLKINERSMRDQRIVRLLFSQTTNLGNRKINLARDCGASWYMWYMETLKGQ